MYIKAVSKLLGNEEKILCVTYRMDKQRKKGREGNNEFEIYIPSRSSNPFIFFTWKALPDA